MTHEEHEELVKKLENKDTLDEYRSESEDHTTSAFASFVATMLVILGNTTFGKKPSLSKFKALEVVARIPYQSWEVATYTLLTGFYQNEAKAIELTKREAFQRTAQDNETMHVVVISQLVKKKGESNAILHTVLPMIFSFFYFWVSYILYMISRKTSHEINYLFETHAFLQYDEYLKVNEAELRKTKIEVAFLKEYGRAVDNEYDFFYSVRSDELIHRHESLMRVKKYK